MEKTLCNRFLTEKFENHEKKTFKNQRNVIQLCCAAIFNRKTPKIMFFFQLEEAARLEDERRIAADIEAQKQAMLQKMQAEQNKHIAEVERQRSELEERFARVSQPMTLVGTHFLPNCKGNHGILRKTRYFYC